MSPSGSPAQTQAQRTLEELMDASLEEILERVTAKAGKKDINDLVREALAQLEQLNLPTGKSMHERVRRIVLQAKLVLN